MKHRATDVSEAERSEPARTNSGVDRPSVSGRQSGHIGKLHQSAGNQAVQQLAQNGELQAKLEVSSPSDPAEREAERVAERVVREDWSRGGVTEDGTEPAQRESSPQVTLSELPDGTSDGGSLSEEGESTVRRGIRDSGRPLSTETRSFFEARFGTDFSDVRVHTGAQADEAARSINAEAYTMGTDIAFARGNYRPGTTKGRELLAHELAHTVQQRGPMDASLSRKSTETAMRQEGEEGGVSRGTVLVLDSEARQEFVNLIGDVAGNTRDGFLESIENGWRRAENQIDRDVLEGQRQVRDEIAEKVQDGVDPIGFAGNAQSVAVALGFSGAGLTALGVLSSVRSAASDLTPASSIQTTDLARQERKLVVEGTYIGMETTLNNMEFKQTAENAVDAWLENAQRQTEMDILTFSDINLEVAARSAQHLLWQQRYLDPQSNTEGMVKRDLVASHFAEYFENFYETLKWKPIMEAQADGPNCQEHHQGTQPPTSAESPPVPSYWGSAPRNGHENR